MIGYAVPVTVLLLATPLQAQVATDAAVDDASEIVVTAQLRPQNPIDVPIALSVTTGADLARLGIDDFEAFARFVPGFIVQNESPNNPGFVLRGITSDSGASFSEQRVSIFQDGVSISKSRGSYVELFDMTRIEVAKGPQSTLYGRGALIGAVNLVQNKADPRDFAARARAEYGNYDSRLAEGMVNLPLSGDAALRLSGRIRQRDGYIPSLLGGRDFNSVDTRAARAAFRANSGRLTFDLIGNYELDRQAGTPFKSIGFRPTDPATGVVIGDAGRNSGAALAPAAGFEGGRRLGTRREVWGVTALAAYEFSDAWRLDSISAYRCFDAFGVFDADGTALPILTAADDVTGRQASQELRLTYRSDRLAAFVGASYFHEDGSQRTPATFDERGVLARLAGALNGGIPGRPATDPAPIGLFADPAFTGALVRGIAASAGAALTPAQAMAIGANLRAAGGEVSTNRARTDAVDVFADAAYRLTDRFEVGGGIRYSHDDKRTRYSASILGGRSVAAGLLAALAQPPAVRDALLGALAAPGAATIPPSAAYPVPLFGLSTQPTANNGDTGSATLGNGGFSWRLTARYEPADATSLYLTYARGRRPQVLSGASPAAPFGPATFAVLPAERVDSYEAGVKTALVGRALFVDGAVFLYDYTDFQTIVQQGTQLVPTNAGRARSYGFEGQARWVAGRALTAFASYAYNHSRFRSGVRAGNRLRLSPDHMGSLGASVSAQLGRGRIGFTPTVTYQSRIFFDDDNDRADLQRPPASLVADTVRDERQSGYALVNARLGYEPDHGRWRIEGYVENLFDRRYVRDAGNTGDAIGLATFVAGDPRFYGVSATVRFGEGR
ncbi:MAG: TonB-dependent receptor [Sphingomonas sp.]